MQRIKEEELLFAIGEIDEELLVFKKGKKNNMLLFKKLSFAACLFLLISVVIYIALDNGFGKIFDVGMDNNAPGNMAPESNAPSMESPDFDSADKEKWHVITLDKYANLKGSNDLEDCSNIIETSNGSIYIEIETEDESDIPSLLLNGEEITPRIHEKVAVYEIKIDSCDENISLILMGENFETKEIIITKEENGYARFEIKSISAAPYTK